MQYVLERSLTMGNAKFYCLSLSRLDEYLVGAKRLSRYPRDDGMNHAIRQIMDLAMETFEKEHLVVPAFPGSFTIDAVAEDFEDALKGFLYDVMMTELTTINISREGEKMNIFLRG